MPDHAPCVKRSIGDCTDPITGGAVSKSCPALCSKDLRKCTLPTEAPPATTAAATTDEPGTATAPAHADTANIVETPADAATGAPAATSAKKKDKASTQDKERLDTPSPGPNPVVAGPVSDGSDGSLGPTVGGETVGAGDDDDVADVDDTGDTGGCGAFKCSATCAGACGWVRAESVCASGASTSEREKELRLGDCSGAENAGSADGGGTGDGDGDSSTYIYAGLGVVCALSFVCLAFAGIRAWRRANGGGADGGGPTFFVGFKPGATPSQYTNNNAVYEQDYGVAPGGPGALAFNPAAGPTYDLGHGATVSSANDAAKAAQHPQTPTLQASRPAVASPGGGGAYVDMGDEDGAGVPVQAYAVIDEAAGAPPPKAVPVAAPKAGQANATLHTYAVIDEPADNESEEEI